MPGLIICLICGLAGIVLGGLISIGGKLSLIHAHHRRHLSEEDVPAFARGFGAGLMLIGAGVCLAGLVSFWGRPGAGWALFVLCFAAGLALILRTQRKYARR